MANFVLSRARRLFSYTDLQGSNGSTMETSSINIENGTSANNSSLPLKKKRKCVIISTCVFGLLVIIVIALGSRHRSRVTTALRNLPAAFSSASSSSETITMDERRVSLFDTSRGRFYPTKWNGTWINGLEFLYSGSDGSLNIFNVKAQNETQIMSAAKMEHFAPFETQLSADKNYLLIKRSMHRVFRRSSYGNYAILSLHNFVLTPLEPSNRSNSQADFMIRYVSWGPQGNALVYVDFDNDIYYRKSVLSQDEQITSNGEAFVNYNGIPDWVFEEEVFEDNKALWWSPDGTKLFWFL